MAHTHGNANTVTRLMKHQHDSHTDYIDCGLGSTHEHTIIFPWAEDHLHSYVVLGFENADLGSPNWWEHQHKLLLVSMDSQGGDHVHTNPDLTIPMGCAYKDCNVEAYQHQHVTNVATSIGNDAHIHALPTGYNTKYTGNAVGTPENHYHPFSSFGCLIDGYHVHSLTGSVTAISCYYKKRHTHTAPSITLEGYHYHVIEGANSGYGGEGAIVVKAPLMDGFVLVS